MMLLDLRLLPVLVVLILLLLYEETKGESFISAGKEMVGCRAMPVDMN